MLLLFAAVLPAQDAISVDELRRNFQTQYKKEVVSIRGWVATEKRVASSSFKGFYLKDRYGSLVLIRTTNALPDITSEIMVTGIAVQDADTADIYLTETKRAPVGKEVEEAARREEQRKQVEAAERRTAEEAAERQRQQDNQRTILIGIGVAVVLLVIVAVVLMRRQRAASLVPPSEIPSPMVTQPPAPVSEAASPSQVDDFKTVRVYKTTKVLPGRLVVLESGKETDIVHLSDQSGRGEIEIGRDSPDITSGIRIKDRSNTMSRRQARMVYTPATREFKLMNLAGDSSNPTVINGRQMSDQEAVTLLDGDVLSMGNVELKFTKK
jgi:hypothetical protein